MSATNTWNQWKTKKGDKNGSMRDDRMLEVLVERLADLEFALEDQGWVRLADQVEREFSPEARRAIYKVARYMWLKNPIIRRAVAIKTDYTWGQGFECNISDDRKNAMLQAWFDEPSNRRAVFGELARRRLDQELQVYGNLFLMKQADNIRSVPVTQIDDIITDADDYTVPLFYKRMVKDTVIYHPDWQIEKNASFTQNDERMDASLIRWDQPIYHVKINALPDMRFGVSDIYAALDWAKAYKQFLEDRASVYRALARFAFKAMGKGAKGISAIKDALTSTFAAGGNAETNPAPAAGSVAIESEGVQFQPMITSNAQSTPEEGRRFLLMCAAATDLPETFFGDAKVGNYATAKTLDRPTELMVMGRQEMWSSIYADLIRWHLGEMDKQTVNIEWPPLLHHDILAGMTAVEKAANMPGVLDTETVQRLVLTLFGVDDIDEVLAKINATTEPD